MFTEQTYFKPASIEEAIKLAKDNENNFRYIAGGTDVIINKFQGNDLSNCLIDISGIEDLQKVTSDNQHVNIGSLIRLDDLKRFPEIANEFPSLLMAAHEVASPMLRKTATLGGNLLCENRCIFYNQSEWWREAVGYCLKCDGDICIATGGKKNCFSKFVSDTAPVLISMDASIEIIDNGGSRRVKLESIYTGDGLNPRKISQNSIISRIILPRGKNFRTIFKKLRPREAVDFTSLTTTVSVDNSGTVRIVLGGVDPKPVIVEGSFSQNNDEMIKLAIKKSRIVDNDFYSRKYRKEMIGVFLRNSFLELQ